MSRPAIPRLWPWVVAFSALFALSLDYWAWDDPPRFAWFHLPRWIGYFVVLQLALAAIVHLFGKRYWRVRHERDDGGPPSR